MSPTIRSLRSFIQNGLVFALAASAMPTSAAPWRRASSSLATLSSSQLSALAPFTNFAGAAYCSSTSVQAWSCGTHCDSLQGFQPTLTGGNGDSEQLFYVGYWPTGNQVVVGHQGTDPTEFLSDLTDIDVILAPLNATLFPNLPSGVEAHSGFQDEQALTIGAISSEVKTLLGQHSGSTLVIVGHSLGGALAELDALWFALNMPSVQVKTVTFGTPRVGNPTFANFFASLNLDFTRVNNEDDPIPIVPFEFMGFSHPGGEIHIVSPNNAVSCPGLDDDNDAQCTDKTVPNLIDSDILDHLGPYQGIYLGSPSCGSG